MISYREADLIPTLNKTKHDYAFNRFSGIIWFHMKTYYNKSEYKNERTGWIKDAAEWAWYQWEASGDFEEYIRARVGEITYKQMMHPMKDEYLKKEFKNVFVNYVRNALKKENPYDTTTEQ